ncbi:dolichyl-phosphate-mannose--protein mannosyltransferase 1 [Monosporozyma servazzii]
MAPKEIKSPEKEKVDLLEPIEVKEGPLRPYLDIETSKELIESRSPSSLLEKGLLAVLIVVGSITRFHKLESPSNVIDHESVVGSIISKYINREFFIGTTPPMAHLAYAFASLFNGFDGSFQFQPVGHPYPNKVPYVTFRFFASLLGVLTVILFYSTLRVSGVRAIVAFAISLALIFENGYITISRYIFDESPYMFFIALAIYLFKRSQLFPMASSKSYVSLVGSAISLGCVISTKWTGAFIVVWVGIALIFKFILTIGDLSKPVCPSVKHTTIKGLLCLIIPTMVYILSFYFHFKLTTHISKDAELLSSEYRYDLIGNDIPENIKAPVGLGSKVSLRHTGTYGGYLHSHEIFYTTGSKQQEVTLYPHNDINNEWTIELYSESGNPITNFTELVDGTKIRFLHHTQCRLHSHDHKPPVSENSDWQKEVSCYGYPGFGGDANDDWVVEIDKDKSEKDAQDSIKAIDTKFRIRHFMSGCYLFSHETQLPATSYKQQEVTCASQGIKDLTLWYIEENDHAFLPEDTERVSYKTPSFFQKFAEIHKKIAYLVAKHDIPSAYSSNPFTWPFMLRGVELSSHNFENVYFIGNAVMWFSTTLFIFIFGAGCVYQLVSWQLGKPIFQNTYVIDFHIQVVEYLLGFAIYMAPFIFLGGNHFIYEYLPAYYFAALALGHGLDYLFVIPSSKTVRQASYVILAVFALANIYFYTNRSHIIDGSMWSQELCERSKWLQSWDYDCNGYTLSTEDFQAQKAQKTKSDADTTFTYGFPVKTDAAKLDEINVVEDLIDEKKDNAVFMDTEGNILDPEEVKRLVEEEGAVLKETNTHR